VIFLAGSALFVIADDGILQQRMAMKEYERLKCYHK